MQVWARLPRLSSPPRAAHSQVQRRSAAASAQLSWQVSTVNFDDGSDCAAKFKSNWWYGALLFSGIISEKLLAV